MFYADPICKILYLSIQELAFSYSFSIIRDHFYEKLIVVSEDSSEHKYAYYFVFLHNALKIEVSLFHFITSL